MKRLLLVAAVVLATAGCSTGIPGQATPQQGDSHQTGPMRAWSVSGDHYNGLATWIYQDDLVVATNTGVIAYQRARGTIDWQASPPDKDHDAFCGASANVSAGGVVSLGVGTVGANPSDITCDRLAVLNLATGKLGWSIKVPNATEAEGMQAGGLVTAVAGSTVVVGWAGVVAGFDLSTGAQKYRVTVHGNGDYSPYDVRDIEVAGSTAYVLSDTGVPVSGGLTPVAVFAADAATGKVVAKDDINTVGYHYTEPSAEAIVATSPLTVLVTDLQDGTDARYFVYDSTLTIKSVIDAGRGLDANESPVPTSLDTFQFTSGMNDDARRVFRTLVVGGTLYSVTTAHTGNQLEAFDLASGKKTWATGTPDRRMLEPVAIDGSTLVTAAVGTGVDAPPEVLRVDPKSGHITSSRKGSTELGEASDDYWFVYADSRLYAVNWEMPERAHNKRVAFAFG